MSALLSVVLLLLAASPLRSAPAATSGGNPLLDSWLNAQTNLHTWSADVVQIRSLKSLSTPLTATGNVWFAAPNRFRWEIRHPGETIAVRAPAELLVIYPRLKRVERYSLAGGQSGPWRDALALLEAGFPRSEAQLKAQYELLSQTVTSHTCELTLRPRSAAAAKIMPRLQVAFDTRDSALVATELEFADGSIMRNEFKNAVLNPELPPDLFDPPIPADYKQVEPLRRR